MFLSFTLKIKSIVGRVSLYHTPKKNSKAKLTPSLATDIYKENIYSDFLNLALQL